MIRNKREMGVTVDVVVWILGKWVSGYVWSRENDRIHSVIKHSKKRDKADIGLPCALGYWPLVRRTMH